MARKNLKVPENLFLAMDDDKDDQQSWPHYLEQQCLHDGDRPADVADRLDGLSMAVKENTEAIQSMKRTLEELQR